MLILNGIVVIAGILQVLTFERVADWLDKICRLLTLGVAGTAAYAAARLNNSREMACERRVLQHLAKQRSCPSYEVPGYVDPNPSFSDMLHELLHIVPLLLTGMLIGLAIRLTWNKFNPGKEIEDKDLASI